MDHMERYNAWVSNPDLDSVLREELEAIAGDENEIKERFYQYPEFGTGGLRGIMGAGTARMNIYTVRRATQGLAQYVLKIGGDRRGVVIAFDSRNNSPLFAREAAGVFAANGINTYLFESLRPTPELSFAVRQLGCAAGVVVTASHNPAKYNGYKVYGEDGGQCTLEASAIIIEEMNKIDEFNDVKTEDIDKAIIDCRIKIVGDKIDTAYLDTVYSHSINPQIVKQAADEFKVVYTPFHGAGNKPVRRIFEMLGIKNVYLVEEQLRPDGNFPTVKSPNPEDPEGFQLAVKLANKNDADLIIGTDPDSDRVGIMVRNTDGEFIPLTGNQTGVLLTEYILSALTETGKMPKNPFVVKTIVTSEMVRKVCEHYNVEILDVLTGFKFIGEKIKELHETGEKSFVFGFEESYGYLAGTYCRDKDAVIASMLIAEMAAYYGTKGMTLYEVFMSLFEKYGVHYEGVKNIVREGLDGAAEIAAMMQRLRDNTPSEMGESKVVTMMDFKHNIRKDMETGKIEQTGLPTSDVLRYELADGTWVAFRPSGTEPKFKIYYGVTANDKTQCERKSKSLSESIEAMLGV